MPELLIPFVNFLIALVVVVLFCLIVYLISKVTTFFSTIAFYFFLSSLLLIAISNNVGVNYLNFYPTMGETIDTLLSYLAQPFVLVYKSFFGGIVGVCSLFMDSTPVNDFLIENTNLVFVTCYQASIFFLSLLIFKKEDKQTNDNSVYRE